MAITYRTVTVDVGKLLGAAVQPGSVKIRVRTNVPPGLVPIDKGASPSKLLLGMDEVTPDSTTGVATIPGLVDHATGSSDVFPTGIQYYFDPIYTDPVTGQRIKDVSFGPYSITGDGDLGDMVSTDLVLPDFRSEFMEQANAILAQQEQIAGLADSDTAQAYNIANGQATKSALSASSGPIATNPFIRKRVRPRCYGVPYYARGTSYTAGAGATNPGTGFVALLGARLGATAVYNTGTGGSPTAQLPYQYIDPNAPVYGAAAGSGAWVPGVSTGIVSIEAGIGEALQSLASNDAQSRIVFEASVKTALRWHRATGFRNMGHASVTRAGSWALENLTQSVTPFANTAKTGTVGDILTIAPGGPSEINLIPICYSYGYGSDANNGDYAVSVDGGPWIQDTTKSRGDVRPTGSNVVYTISSLRVTGLTPTSTVRVKLVGAGEIHLAGYLTMDNPAPPPIILVQDCHLLGAQLPATTNNAAAPVGTAGSTSYRYRITAIDPAGRETAGSTVASTTTGNATLSSTNYVKVSWTAVDGATGYGIYAYNTSDAKYYYIGSAATNTFNDTGYALSQKVCPETNSTSVGPWLFPIGSAIQNDPLRSNQTLETYRAIVRRIASSPEFADGTVAVADPMERWDPNTHLYTDRIHPNQLGHQDPYLNACLRAVESLTYTGA